MVGFGRYQCGQALFSPLKLRSEGLAPASAAQSADAIVFAISCQYDNSQPRHHAVANHQIYMPSYRVVSTLPVPAVLRAAKSAQDGGYERHQEQAEDDQVPVWWERTPGCRVARRISALRIILESKDI